MRTAQQLFDTIVDHLRKQGKRAIGPSIANPNRTVCKYRTEDGLSCAIGCLMSQSQYHPSFEDHGIEVLLEENGLPIDLLVELKPYQDMLGRMQTVHDSAPVDKWEDRFQGVAADYGLQYTPLPKEETRDE